MRRGRRRTYSDLAITCALTLREVYHLPLRATVLGRILPCVVSKARLTSSFVRENLPPPRLRMFKWLIAFHK